MSPFDIYIRGDFFALYIQDYDNFVAAVFVLLILHSNRKESRFYTIMFDDWLLWETMLCTFVIDFNLNLINKV